MQLERDDDLIDLEFVTVCRRENYPIIEVPVLATTRHGGRSTTGYGSAVRMYWGAYAMLAALAMLRSDWTESMLSILTPELDQSVVEALIRDGPAVDGVSLRREATIDALGMSVHHEVMVAIREIVSEQPLALR